MKLPDLVDPLRDAEKAKSDLVKASEVMGSDLICVISHELEDRNLGLRINLLGIESENLLLKG